MARLRGPEPTADDLGVPAELRDWDAPCWRDPVEFRAWVSVNLPGEQAARRMEYLCGPNGHGPRFDFAVIEWARCNGFRHPRWPNSLDHDRMKAAGLSLMPALERQRRRTVLTEW